MKKLIDIIGDSKILNHVEMDVSINEIKFDSRSVVSGDLYVAIKGSVFDGHDYIVSAVENGAAAVVCERIPEGLDELTMFLVVKDSRRVLSQMARRYFDDPSQKVNLIGVTGTNGKTTVATLLYQLFKGLGYKVGLISTVENIIDEQKVVATHTTPDIVSLNALLSEMVNAGCEYVFMEVSSHAVDQKRILGVRFTGGVFTNLSHDHLDYHKTYDNYIKAKKCFFDDLSEESFALTNVDDKVGEVMLQNTKARKLGYGLQRMTDYKGKIIHNSIAGLALQINEVEAHYRMIGTFNAYNLLAAYAVAAELGFHKEEILTVLTNLVGAEGRFETVIVQHSSKVGIVDYAHTPDALVNVLETINKIKTAKSNVLTIIGCGGDRDKAKRPVMARVAVQLSSKVIFTNDNPRTENPDDILDQMEEGLSDENRRNVLRISDRKQAIKTAVMLADANDIILVAGKGHEKYQDINGIKYPFDDKRVLEAAML